MGVGGLGRVSRKRLRGRKRKTNEGESYTVKYKSILQQQNKQSV